MIKEIIKMLKVGIKIQLFYSKYLYNPVIKWAFFEAPNNYNSFCDSQANIIKSKEKILDFEITQIIGGIGK